MPSDVFISYSHKDKITTDLMCDTLEENGIKCWVAPRDILPGSEWSGAIIHGIESTKIMVLVFSNHSNISGQVVREVERAVSKNIIIIPFKIEDVKMSPSMEYLVSMSHWLNACDQPLENKLTELVENVKKLMQAKNPINHNNNSENIGNTNSKLPYWRRRINLTLAFSYGKVVAGFAVLCCISLVCFNQFIFQSNYNTFFDNTSRIGSIEKSNKNEIIPNNIPREVGVLPLTISDLEKDKDKKDLSSKDKVKHNTEIDSPRNLKSKESSKKNDKESSKKNDTEPKVSTKKATEVPSSQLKKNLIDKTDDYKIGLIKLEMKAKIISSNQVDFMFSAYNTKNNFSSIGDWINKNQTIFQNKLIYLGLADGVWISNPSSNKWPPIINNDIATFQYSFKKVK